jgi:hypothetical protein
MRGNYIDFISAYCDRWCERCAFTDRCSAYAVDVATEMCGGDFEAGIELAVGAPPPMNEAEAKRREAFVAALPNVEPTAAEMEEYTREHDAREERLDEQRLTTASQMTMLVSRAWLANHSERLLNDAPAELADAIAVARWDVFLIYVKLRRALRGRDESRGWRFGRGRIQNDWNGSAKLALLLIERSAVAWDTLAKATADPDAADVAGRLRMLQRQVDEEFPQARRFRRPGFDDGRRKGE